MRGDTRSTPVPTGIGRLAVLMALLAGCRGYHPSAATHDVSSNVDTPPTDSDSDRTLDTDVSTNDTDVDWVSPCKNIDGTSLTAGPVDLYGFCWYLGAPAQTCDDACAEVGGENLAIAAESTFPDSPDYPGPEGVVMWFYDHGNPGEWTYGTWTAGHVLGYGYVGDQFSGKCAACTMPTGTYPGEPMDTRFPYGGLPQLVCACFESDEP